MNNKNRHFGRRSCSLEFTIIKILLCLLDDIPFAFGHFEVCARMYARA